jgi:hypothetical protein
MINFFAPFSLDKVLGLILIFAAFFFGLGLEKDFFLQKNSKWGIDEQ